MRHFQGFVMSQNVTNSACDHVTKCYKIAYLRDILMRDKFRNCVVIRWFV